MSEGSLLARWARIADQLAAEESGDQMDELLAQSVPRDADLEMDGLVEEEASAPDTMVAIAVARDLARGAAIASMEVPGAPSPIETFNLEEDALPPERTLEEGVVRPESVNQILSAFADNILEAVPEGVSIEKQLETFLIRLAEIVDILNQTEFFPLPSREEADTDSRYLLTRVASPNAANREFFVRALFNGLNPRHPKYSELTNTLTGAIHVIINAKGQISGSRQLYNVIRNVLKVMPRNTEDLFKGRHHDSAADELPGPQDTIAFRRVAPELSAPPVPIPEPELFPGATMEGYPSPDPTRFSPDLDEPDLPPARFTESALFAGVWDRDEEPIDPRVCEPSIQLEGLDEIEEVATPNLHRREDFDPASIIPNPTDEGRPPYGILPGLDPKGFITGSRRPRHWPVVVLSFAALAAIAVAVRQSAQTSVAVLDHGKPLQPSTATHTPKVVREAVAAKAKVSSRPLRSKEAAPAETEVKKRTLVRNLLNYPLGVYKAAILRAWRAQGDEAISFAFDAARKGYIVRLTNAGRKFIGFIPHKYKPGQQITLQELD